MIKQFLEFYDYYNDVCTENLNKDGEPMMDPFGERRGQFDYTSILTRLKNLKTKLENIESSPEKPKMDSRTREIMNDAASLDANLQTTNDGDLADIFDDVEEEEEEDDDYDIEQSEETPTN